MSKRPKTATGVMSRLRRPADRLRDLPIWSKLGLIMLVPTLATIIVGVSGLVDHIDTASNAERARTLSVLSEAAGGLVDHLQNERAYGVMVVTNDVKSPVRAAALKAYNDEHPQVDQAKVPYSQQKAALDDVPPKVGTLLLRLDRNLEDLPSKRSQIANGKLQVADVEDTYNKLIDDLLSVRDVSAQLASDTTLSDHLRSVAAVAQAKEFVSQQRDIGHEVLGERDFNAALRRKFLLTDTGFQLAGSDSAGGRHRLREAALRADQERAGRPRRDQPDRPAPVAAGRQHPQHPVRLPVLGDGDDRLQQAVPSGGAEDGRRHRGAGDDAA